LLALPGLYGGAEVLDAAAARLPDAPEIRRALGDLRELARQLSPGLPNLNFDLSESRGYRYHSGVVFAAYVSGSPNALALGGRYDEVGKAFGRARPATGFSADLRALAALAPAAVESRPIRAPYSEDPALAGKIRALREAGEVVIVELPGHEATRAELACDRQLVLKGDRWEVSPIG
jgi:ATP phosphoribosyltransferase regulatory subunit